MLIQLPSLPMADHSLATRAAGDATGKFYDSKVTCQDCHVAGEQQLHSRIEGMSWLSCIWNSVTVECVQIQWQLNVH